MPGAYQYTRFIKFFFKKYCHFTGLDIAQVINGYVYHTEYDVIDHISHECLQNSGDNVLSLVRGLANATELYNTEVSSSLRLGKLTNSINSSYTGTSSGASCLLRLFGTLLRSLLGGDWPTVELQYCSCCCCSCVPLNVAHGVGFRRSLQQLYLLPLSGSNYPAYLFHTCIGISHCN